MVRLALRGAQRLNAMIDDLLDLARLEAGAARLSLSRVDLARLMGTLVESTTPYAVGLGITLTLDAPAETVEVIGDGGKIERIGANLLSNALKFSPAGSEVTVRVRGGEREVSLAVVDRGSGVAPEDRQRIFGRFERGGTPGRSPGTGIGLAVVREFATLHGGRVELQSELGRGSVFTVFLPRDERGSAATLPLYEGPRRLRSLTPHALIPEEGSAGVSVVRARGR
jgi:signal transduction histidine kinase